MKVVRTISIPGLIVVVISCAQPFGSVPDPSQAAVEHYLVALAQGGMMADDVTRMFHSEPQCSGLGIKRTMPGWLGRHGSYSCHWESAECLLWAWDGTEWLTVTASSGCGLRCVVTPSGRTDRCQYEVRSSTH